MPTDERDTIADALRAQQVQSHFASVPWAIGGAIFTALFFVALERDAIEPRALLAWLGALALVLGGAGR